MSTENEGSVIITEEQDDQVHHDEDAQMHGIVEQESADAVPVQAMPVQVDSEREMVGATDDESGPNPPEAEDVLMRSSSTGSLKFHPLVDGSDVSMRSLSEGLHQEPTPSVLEESTVELQHGIEASTSRIEVGTDGDALFRESQGESVHREEVDMDNLSCHSLLYNEGDASSVGVDEGVVHSVVLEDDGDSEMHEMEGSHSSVVEKSHLSDLEQDSVGHALSVIHEVSGLTQDERSNANEESRSGQVGEIKSEAELSYHSRDPEDEVAAGTRLLLPHERDSGLEHSRISEGEDRSTTYSAADVIHGYENESKADRIGDIIANDTRYTTSSEEQLGALDVKASLHDHQESTTAMSSVPNNHMSGSHENSTLKHSSATQFNQGTQLDFPPGEMVTENSTNYQGSYTLYVSEKTPESEELMETFFQAEHFVAVVLSRLRQDRMVVHPQMLEFQAKANYLWALKQQALRGSCESYRGTREYVSLADEDSTSSYIAWPPCCFRMVGASKFKLWQALGDMAKDDAKRKYIEEVSNIAPDWQSPGDLYTAFLRTWTPDNESDRCTICEECFTFLNRRHHCRRCLSLVCAVCSPHAVSLRAFAHAPSKRQRVCIPCFMELQEIATTEIEHEDASDAEETRAEKKPLLEVKLPEKLKNEGVVGAVAVEPPVSPGTAVMTIESRRKEMEANDADESAVSIESTPSSISVISQSQTHAIQSGMLECYQSSGFKKSWKAFFFVLLVRKGSLGMFASAEDHINKVRPLAVHKLSGYSVRVKSQQRRPHQFRLSHPSKKLLHFSASNIEEMNQWINALTKAIEMANELEATIANGRRPSSSQISLLHEKSNISEQDFEEHAGGLTSGCKSPVSVAEL